MKTFENNKQYYCRSVCDHNCIWLFRVLNRTNKTVSIIDDKGKTKRCKINTDENGNEFIFPLGRYSMAPILRAEREA